jgi:hypothetical protein
MRSSGGRHTRSLWPCPTIPEAEDSQTEGNHHSRANVLARIRVQR